jgi:hypothetical protein
MRFWPKCIIWLLNFSSIFSACANIDTTTFARVGLSDNEELQAALTFCSEKNSTCVIPSGKTYQISTDLFIWGGASLVGTGLGSGIRFKPIDGARALLQVGLAPKNMKPYATTPYIPKPVFTGKIENLNLKIDSEVTREVLAGFDKKQVDSAAQRVFRPYKLIFMWRTDGAEIKNNRVEVGHSKYGFTGSGNDANFVPAGTANPGAWVGAANHLVRKNIRITNNQLASLDYQWTERGKNSDGNEGIALTLFNGAYIAHNTIGGFGDDVLALHSVNNAIVEQNFGESVDGRLYVSGSNCVAVLYNTLVRRLTTLYKKTGPHEFPNGWGASLLTLDGESRSPPTTQSIIYGNSLFVPAGLREDAMHFASVRAAQISNNMLMQPADASQFGPLIDANLAIKTGLRLTLIKHMNSAYDRVPVCFKGTDLSLPNGLKFLPIVGDNYHLAIANYMPVRNVTIENNNLAPDNNRIFTAAGIAMQEHPTVSAREKRPPSQELLGFVTRDKLTCNKAKIVGKTQCHTVAVVNNRAGQLPWHTCSQNLFSSGHTSAAAGNASNCTELSNQGMDKNLAKGKSEFFERIYYEGNQTAADKTLNDSEFAALVPGVIQAEYFHNAGATLEQLPEAKLCRNPFGKNLPGQPTQDILGGCELIPPKGAWVEYSLNVLEPGNYRLTMRARVEKEPGEMAASVDDGAPMKMTVFEQSAADVVVKNIPLTKGAHRVRLNSMTGGIRINYLKLEIVRGK